MTIFDQAKQALAILLSYTIVFAQVAPLEAQSQNVLPNSAMTSSLDAVGRQTFATGPAFEEQNSEIAINTSQPSNVLVASLAGQQSQSETPQTLLSTTTKVVTSGSPSFVGQSVTFTATVTSTGHTIPDGETVTFYNGTAELGTGTTSAGVATFATLSLAAGNHTIKATYSGDSTFKTSSGTVKQVVDKYATTTTLTSSANPADFKQLVTYTATVTSTGPNTPTGKVDIVGVATESLNSAGVVTVTKGLTAGTHALIAKYAGDSDSAASNSQVLDEVVEPALYGDPGGPYSGNAGQTITFNGTGSTAPKGQKITSYAWNFGDNSTGTGSTPTHSYTSAGTYTVSLEITDTKGLTDTNTTTATITSAGPPPTITGFNPGSGPEGTPISLSGTNLTGTGSTTPVVTLSHQGGGTISAPLSNYSANSINFVIPAGAATGIVKVTVGTQSAMSSTALNVTTSSSFSVGVAPSAGSVIQGQSTTLAVTLNSANGFTGLSSLSVTGLPGGVTANFNPASISVNQTSVLTLSAPLSQPTGSSSLTVTASATIAGQLVTQSATASLQVNGVSTTFLGRTVVDNAAQTPIAGVLVMFLGVDDKGNKTGCSAQTSSDASGNFVLSNLPAACTGPQLVYFNGLTATAPTGTYAGVNLSYTIVANQVTTSPVLINLPRIDNAETNYVTQNASVDQVFTFQTDPRVVITVYAGTTLTLEDGTTPNPFPLVAVEVPVDRLPDAMPSSGMLMPFIVAFQPANAMASQPVAVDFPNLLNIPPGGSATLMTLNPTLGYMVSYGTGSVSTDGSRIVPDPDPNNPGHLYGLVHFDWHGPTAPPPPPTGPGPGPPCPGCCSGSGGSGGGGGGAGGGGGGGGAGGGGGGPEGGDPVDLSSGLQVVRATDIVLEGGRGSVSINRVFRSMDTNPGPFGIGTNHNYGHLLSTQNFIKGICQCLTLVMPDGNQFLFNETGANTFTNSTIPSLIGTQITIPTAGIYNLRWKNGTVYQFSTSSQGALLAFLNTITDSNGNTITLVRGNSSQPSQVTQITDAVGRSLTLTYDSTNRITLITDPIGRTVQYTYNSQGTLATVTNAAGGVTTYAYDTSNNLLKTTDARGVVVMQDTYDSNGRVVQQIQADGGVLNFAYTLLNSQVPTSPVLQTIFTDGLGNSTTYRFDSNQNLLSVVDPTGQSRVFNHSLQQNNLVTSVTGGGTCPICGSPGAGDVSFTYDSMGNILTKTDSLGNTTTTTYDPTYGQVTSITDQLGNVYKYTYDASGNMLTATDPNGNTTTYSYNSFGQTLQVTDPLGGKTTRTYDSFGNRTTSTDQLNHTSNFTYDGVSRVVQGVDPLGRTFAMTYDAMDRLLTRKDPQGHVITFTLDPNGNILTQVDESGNTLTFTYDPMNRLLSKTDPRGKTDTRTYDFNGNLTKFVDRRGQVSTFTYDGLNHLLGESYQDSSKVSRSYDARGRLLEVIDSVGGTFDFVYDADGRRTSSSGPFGTIQQSYDAAGKVTSTQVAGQSAVAYTYDATGNLLTASQPAASATLAYDTRNRLTSITRPNGVSSQYTWDAAKDLLSLTHSGGQGIDVPFTYTYDAASNRSTYSTNFSQPQAVANTFDSDNRITKSGSTSYTYDDNGNLTTSVDSTGTTTYAWDTRNRLTSISAPSGQNTTFVYDFLGNLTQQSDAGPTLNLTQSFVLDDLTNVAYIARNNGDSVSVLAGRTIDQDLAVVHASGQVEYKLGDAIDSTQATVDQTGKLVSSFSYEPFGKTTTTSTYPFQFTGRVPVTAGLYYYRARYYCPAVGRFVSEDPLGSASGDTLLYKYTGNNPVNRTDSSGRLSDCGKCNLALGGGMTVLCGIGAIAGAAACVGTAGIACPVAVAVWTSLCAVVAVGGPILLCDGICNPPPEPPKSCPAK
jgi:RHS repeat-associated protein